MIKEVIDKILKQAEKGIVTIGEKESSWTYKIRFFANIGTSKKENVDDKYLVVDIPDFKLFVSKVEKYLNKAAPFYKKDQEYFGLNDKGYLEKLFLFLMVNMSAADAANVYEYIDNRTKMLEGDYSKNCFGLGQFSYKKGLSSQDVWMGGLVSKNRSSLEGPYKFSIMCISDKGDQFNLPAITFGIAEDVVYVYAVQNTKVKQGGVLAKDLDRYFRKVNKGIDSDDMIANVSPNALVALTIFNAYIEKLGVKKMIAKDFLPLRYMASVDSPKGESEEGLQKIDRDQFNMTNKFMYLFLRYGYHFPSSEAAYDDAKGEVSVGLGGEKAVEENIIYQLSDAVKNYDDFENELEN